VLLRQRRAYINYFKTHKPKNLSKVIILLAQT
jgi:hypothetical protein